MEKLTAQEEMAMRLIWEIGPCVVRTLQEKYPEPKPPYTSLASVVKNLERKGYVKNRRCGNVYEYYPLVSREEYRTAFMKDAVSNLFSNSYKELVSFFAKEEKISADDLRDIIEKIETGKE